MDDWWPVLLAGGAFAVAAFLSASLPRFQRAARRRSPFHDDFLKAPGHALRAGVEDSARAIHSGLFLAGTWPLLVLGLWAVLHWLGGVERTFFTDASAAGLLLLGWLLGLYRFSQAEGRHRRLRMALDAEIATGQVLAPLSARGCRVVHDVETGAGRAGHVVVSPAGVYAVYTLPRRRGWRGGGKEEVTAFVNGDDIRFPGGSDSVSVQRAREIAIALAEALQSKLGHTVSVRPVVLMPGWHVERRLGSDVQVLNPREAHVFLAGAPVNGPERVERIAEALESLAPRPAPPPRPRPDVPERREPTLD
ncbi:MAG: hypothetical protein P8102_06140 [Gammaproteobacteria bacterium]